MARAEFPNILTQKEELDLDAQVIALETFKAESLVTASGEAEEGVLIPFFAETTDYVDYKQKYKNKYEEEPALYSEYGYDALMSLAKAIEIAGTTNSEEVKGALYNLKFGGAMGIVEFDEYGEAEGKDFIIYQVKNQKIVEY